MTPTPGSAAADGRRSIPSQRTLAIVAIVALALAWASIVQENGWGQHAHYALVRALSHNTAIIDADRDTTGDVSYTEGHYYSVKAPGLATISLPTYLVAHAIDAGLSSRTMIWLLNLL